VRTEGGRGVGHFAKSLAISSSEFLLAFILPRVLKLAGLKIDTVMESHRKHHPPRWLMTPGATAGSFVLINFPAQVPPFSNRPDAERRARRCEHDRDQFPQNTTMADCSLLGHCSYSLRLGNRRYAPFFFGANAPLAAPHPVVEIENVEFNLVVDSILRSAGHLQRAKNAAWITTA
jgi:hypothetical protein